MTHVFITQDTDMEAEKQGMELHVREEMCSQKTFSWKKVSSFKLWWSSLARLALHGCGGLLFGLKLPTRAHIHVLIFFSDGHKLSSNAQTLKNKFV